MLSMLLSGAVVVGAQENYSSWSQHKPLYLNASTVGVTSNVRKFPVLVRLDSSNFSAGFSQTLHGGIDIRFTKTGDAIRLPHQIDRWDSAKKSALVWVLADTIYGGTNNQSLRMHWGKTGAADSSNGKTVFDTGAGFQAVFHFNEATGDTARDATPNGFKASPRTQGTAGRMPEDTLGALGRAKHFNGNTGTTAAGGYYQIENSASGALNFPMDGPYTLSAWVQVDTLQAQNQYRIIVSKSDLQYNLMKNNSTSGQWEFNPYVTSPTQGWERTLQSPVTQHAWQHLVGVRYGNGVDSLFLDGVANTTASSTTTSNTTRNETYNVWIGRRGDPGTSTTAANNRMWLGSIDELRLANVARGSDWVELEFANQKPAQTLVTFDAPTAITPHASNAFQGLFSARRLGNGMVFEAPGRSSRASISVYDLRGFKVWGESVDLRNTRRIFWNGNSVRGLKASNGIYAARLVLLDAQNRTEQTQEISFAFLH